MKPARAAFVGFTFCLPFIVANFIVVRKIEPIYTFLHSITLNTFNFFLPLLLLSLIPIGSFISIKPILKIENGKRKFYRLNFLVSITMLIVFLILCTAFGEEIYRCEILKIPNCD